MKKRDVINYYSTCKEHYPMSDEFVRKYQQNKGNLPETDHGYIKTAYDCGIEIDVEKAEPNQKWHLLVSYYGVDKIGFDINDEVLDRNVTIWSMGDEKTGKGGNGIKCPELLLWMAEAAGCDIRDAKMEAEKLCEKGERLLACNAIKKIIPWEKVENNILTSRTQKGNNT